MPREHSRFYGEKRNGVNFPGRAKSAEEVYLTQAAASRELSVASHRRCSDGDCEAGAKTHAFATRSKSLCAEDNRHTHVAGLRDSSFANGPTRKSLGGNLSAGGDHTMGVRCSVGARDPQGQRGEGTDYAPSGYQFQSPTTFFGAPRHIVEAVRALPVAEETYIGENLKESKSELLRRRGSRPLPPIVKSRDIFHRDERQDRTSRTNVREGDLKRVLQQHRFVKESSMLASRKSMPSCMAQHLSPFTCPQDDCGGAVVGVETKGILRLVATALCLIADLFSGLVCLVVNAGGAVLSHCPPWAETSPEDPCRALRRRGSAPGGPSLDGSVGQSSVYSPHSMWWGWDALTEDFNPGY